MDSDTERHLAELLEGVKQELSKNTELQSQQHRQQLMTALRGAYDNHTSECRAFVTQYSQLTSQTLQSSRSVCQQVEEIRHGIEQLRPY